ncbi:hypothetical protein [Actinophytocola glycyrrhizae]|uniref:Uncharacterized protein n=1 Tax=Actinophytocola glycyrrhizae TaxID=2044873 RepID=A0ABV9S9H5_9PSEU
MTPDGCPVALKVIRAENAGDREFRIRFHREIMAASRGSGAHTFPVIDADLAGPAPWLATAAALTTGRRACR